MVPDELLQYLDCVICKLDTNGYILYASPSIEKLSGYTPAELINSPFVVVYPDPVLAKARMDYQLQQAAKTGSFSSDELQKRKDGTFYWSQTTFKPLYNEGGNLTAYVATLVDITERKETESKLRRSEESFRIMVEAVRDYAIFKLDKYGNIVTWNEGGQRIKGYTAQEIIGKHFSIFYTKEDLDIKKPENELRIALATGKYEEEGWRIRKNGSVFWANVVITALFNENNEHIGFSKVTRDLSERKFSDERLRQSEIRTRLLIEQVKEYGIFMLDEKGRIISWNEGAKRINGYEEEEIRGKYFSIFYLQEDKLNNKPSYELKVANETGKFEEEGWRVRKDGSVFWANVVITAVRDDKGQLIGYSKVTRDLSERQQAEKALRESFDQTRELAIKLTKANQELSNANQELEQFNSIVSHDLQEPIRTIKSFLTLVDKKLDDSQGSIKNYITKAIAATTRMRDLIQSLLNYSQLTKEDMELEDIDVNELLSEVLQNLNASITASEARVYASIHVPFLKGYRYQLLQLIQNLLSNALKFTAEVKPLVEIKNIEYKDGVLFSVSDNGIGIEKKDLHKIFEIFRRLNTKEEYPGTGIGLAISKKIVERHNGQIWVESEPGKGTTFYFTLNTEPVKLDNAVLQNDGNEKG